MADNKQHIASKISHSGVQKIKAMHQTSSPSGKGKVVKTNTDLRNK